MKKHNSRILTLLLVIFSLISSGCAYQIGKTIDERTPDYKIVERYNYNNIEINRDITIYQKDRSVIKGKFIEITEGSLTLETNFGLENVNMEDIVTIEAKSKKNAMWKGLGIGFALDIAYVALLARSIAAEGN